MSSAAKVLKIAKAELGYLEKASNAQLDSKTANAGYANYTKYARDIDAIPHFYNGPKQGYPWCTTFVAWVNVQAFGVAEAKRLQNLPDDSLGAGVYYLKQYYKAAGRLGNTPKVGAQVFFGDEHTGIVTEIVGKGFRTIEGNTSPQSGVVANGGGVYAKEYSSVKSTYTFGYPDYTESGEADGGTTPMVEKPKIYLSPAYHMANECCYKRPDGQQCYETLENNEFLDILEPMLVRCGFDIMRGPRRTPMSDEYGPDYMYRAIDESNKWGAKVHYVSHTNGSTTGTTGRGKVKGFESLYHPSSANGKKLAELMVKYRKAIYPYGCRTVARGDLHELDDTKAYAVYQEHVYHDNLEDAAWFHEHMTECAVADCKALCEFCGLVYIPEPEPTPEPEPDPTPTPTPSKDGSVSITFPLLKKGTTGNKVKALQATLIGYGYNCGGYGADGDFGDGTYKSVKAYQEANGLTSDGEAGENTWKKLMGE